MSAPFTYTKNGNAPLEGLRHEVEWRISDEVVIFIERYFNDDDMVKESTHVKLLAGVSMDGISTI